MDPASNVGGFFQRYGIWIMGGALVFLASWFILGRKNAASAAASQGLSPSAIGPNGQPITPTEYVPTTGDSFTNINYQSGNSSVDTHNSSSTTDNDVVPPPPTPAPKPAPTPAPPPVDHDGGDHDGHDHDGGHPVPPPVKVPPPVQAPPPVVKPPVPPVKPPTPTETDAQKAVDDWQKANNKKWTGPAGSFPYGWGPSPHAKGAGVVNNGVFSYVVTP